MHIRTYTNIHTLFLQLQDRHFVVLILNQHALDDVCVYVCMYACMYDYEATRPGIMYVCMHMYACMYVCMCGPDQWS